MADLTSEYTTAAVTTARREEMDCAICLAPLSNKRIAVLHPCEHQFHRTCILNWFDSLHWAILVGLPKLTDEDSPNWGWKRAGTPGVTWSSNHTCCMCRTRVRIAFDEQGRRIRSPINRKEAEIATESVRPGFKHDRWIQVLSQWRESLVAYDYHLAVQKKIALGSGQFGNEYMNDIDEEIDKNLSRMDAADRMIARCKKNKRKVEAKAAEEIHQRMADKLSDLRVADENYEISEECAICLAPLSSKRTAILKPCGHRFHRTCVLMWFEVIPTTALDEQPQVLTLPCADVQSRGTKYCSVIPCRKKRGGLMFEYFTFRVLKIIQVSSIQELVLQRGWQHFYERVKDMHTFRDFIIIRIDNLTGQKHAALAVGKGMEYIADIDQEKETMELRLKTVDEIFVKMSQMRIGIIQSFNFLFHSLTSFIKIEYSSIGISSMFAPFLHCILKISIYVQEMPDLRFVVNNSETNDQPDCAICFAPLSSKRTAMLDPCRHRFHRTCILRWFESLCSPTVPWMSDHTCCICRAVTSNVYDENGRHINRLYPFEQEEERIIRASAQPGFYFDRSYKNLNFSRDLILVRLNNLASQKRHAFAGAKGAEYITDIDQEMAERDASQ
ncbi:hypothetical protein PRIPAC_90893 [Pristionchus pacificus]|uniref:Zinc finger protein n=1 Tax=Pristionchus pacificus TaxID=54126 RepID=A0A2A6B7P4_PRIPA|nr:hypothetical protein PRIPAC_90893 [Pristionchus pacificus]|eukprot:PDM61881.1 zinc finger protein [Pristionchus pacificus]